MPQHLPDVTLSPGRNPDPGESIRDQQVQDMQGIARVRFLLAHHRSTDLSRISDPEFVPVFTEHSFKPWRVARGLHPDARWTRKSSVKLPRFSGLVLQSAFDDLACGRIHHCNLLKACVKITSDY
jgi:hypothetical protein